MEETGVPRVASSDAWLGNFNLDFLGGLGTWLSDYGVTLAVVLVVLQ